MSNVDRRTILATGALALAGTAVQGGDGRGAGRSEIDFSGWHHDHPDRG